MNRVVRVPSSHISIQVCILSTKACLSLIWSEISRLNSALIFRRSYCINSLVSALKAQISSSACFCAGMFESYLVKNQTGSRYEA